MIGVYFLFLKTLVPLVLAEMPIASGAAGRVDVGVDNSTIWTPDGLKKNTKPANRNCDSYLQRYQEQIKKNKTTLLQDIMQDTTDVGDHKKDGVKEKKLQTNGIGEDQPSGKPSGGERPKKSKLCIIL